MLKVIDHELFSGNRVRELQMYRPPVNAFNSELLALIKTEILAAEQEGVGAMVLSGGGSVFSAGLDVKESAQLSRDQISQTFQGLKDVTLTIGQSRIPIASAITGNCMGAGAIFALFCDYRVMSKDRANIGITEVRGGMTMQRHIIHALARIVGEHQAQRLILEASVLDGSEAHQMGLVDELVSRHLVVSRAVAWCDRMLKLPTKAMTSTREIARTSIREMLVEMDAQTIEVRVNEWFDENIQGTLKKLLKL